MAKTCDQKVHAFASLMVECHDGDLYGGRAIHADRLALILQQAMEDYFADVDAEQSKMTSQ